MSGHPTSEAFQELRHAIAKTLDSVKAGQFSLKAFDRILHLCQSIPMQSSELRAMMRRGHGAMECCLSAEFGAAKFDLRMMLKIVERLTAQHSMQMNTTHVVTRKAYVKANQSRVAAYPPMMQA